ncbi:MAG: hypothetical protein JWN08_3786 [Frankiales bacterium]|jgi:hypothetical protein|nr:hypothetical protein [Frankiales bacterium]
MPFSRHHEEQVVDAGSEELHALARKKVQEALAGLGARSDRAPAPALEEVVVPSEATRPVEDSVVQQAVERMREQLGDVCALDRDGRELTLPELARVVIGSLPPVVRDAYTTAALLQAVAEEPLPSGIEAERPGHEQPRPAVVTAAPEVLRQHLHAESVGPWSEAAQAREERLLAALASRYVAPQCP